MTDESFMTDIDILCEEYEKRVDEVSAEYKQKIEESKDIMKLAMKYRYEHGCDTVTLLMERGIPEDVAIKL